MRKLFLGVAWKPEVPTKTNRLQRKASMESRRWHCHPGSGVNSSVSAGNGTPLLGKI
ncbi:hypothetical protein LEMLEM_LOCUS10706, partial [Lemmus lemmus]